MQALQESLQWMMNPYVLIPLVTWSITVKGLALWYSARASQKAWFVAILVVNTIGILELVYIFLFRRKAQQR
ncbi:hypothetical protein KEJ39_09395 [Candidatus Bathyarchaeota archaeon]|nr:hypothetical protein [Candidatus Bathyarchaeota archaeon]